jgi:hypothetical protein
LNALYRPLRGLACLLWLSTFGQLGYCNGDLIEITASDNIIPLSSRLEYLKNKYVLPNATPSDVDANVGNWKPTRASNDSVRLRAGHYWLRATLINRSENSRDLFISNDYPSINQLALYAIDAHGNVTPLIENAGLEHAYSNTIALSRNLAAEIKLLPNQTVTLLWNIESKPLFRFRPIAWDKKTYEQQNQLRSFWINGFYLNMLLLAFINLFLLLRSKNKTYAYFLTYLLTTTYMIAANQGDLYEYILPTVAWPKISLYVIVFAINVSSFCLFTSTYLNLRQRFPGQNLALQITAGTSGLLMLLSGFFNQEFALLSAIWLSTMMYLLALMTGLRIHRRNMQNSGFFIIGLTLLLLSMIATSLALSGILPLAMSAQTYAVIGSGLMLLFCTLGLTNAANHDNNLVSSPLASSVE